MKWKTSEWSNDIPFAFIFHSLWQMKRELELGDTLPFKDMVLNLFEHFNFGSVYTSYFETYTFTLYNNTCLWRCKLVMRKLTWFYFLFLCQCHACPLNSRPTTLWHRTAVERTNVYKHNLCNQPAVVLRKGHFLDKEIFHLWSINVNVVISKCTPLISACDT